MQKKIDAFGGRHSLQVFKDSFQRQREMWDLSPSLVQCIDLRQNYVGGFSKGIPRDSSHVIGNI